MAAPQYLLGSVEDEPTREGGTAAEADHHDVTPDRRHVVEPSR